MKQNIHKRTPVKVRSFPFELIKFYERTISSGTSKLLRKRTLQITSDGDLEIKDFAMRFNPVLNHPSNGSYCIHPFSYDYLNRCVNESGAYHLYDMTRENWKEYITLDEEERQNDPEEKPDIVLPYHVLSFPVYLFTAYEETYLSRDEHDPVTDIGDVYMTAPGELMIKHNNYGFGWSNVCVVSFEKCQKYVSQSKDPYAKYFIGMDQDNWESYIHVKNFEASELKLSPEEFQQGEETRETSGSAKSGGARGQSWCAMKNGDDYFGRLYFGNNNIVKLGYWHLSNEIFDNIAENNGWEMIKSGDPLWIYVDSREDKKRWVLDNHWSKYAGWDKKFAGWQFIECEDLVDGADIELKEF